MGDSDRALEIAREVGFPILSGNGGLYACPPGAGANVTEMLKEFYARAQSDLLDCDGR